jgi:hypothetical protein
LTRNEKIYAYFNKLSSISAWHAHTVEELERELATSIIASSRIGQSSPRFLIEPARMWSQPPCSFVTCPSHRTPRPIEPVMKSEAPRDRYHAAGREFRLEAVCEALLTGERGLGSSRARLMEQGGLCP